MSDIVTSVLLIGGAYLGYQVFQKASYEYQYNQARKNYTPFRCSNKMGKTLVDAKTGDRVRIFSKPECDAMNADSFFPWYGYFWNGFGGECIKSPSTLYYDGGSFSWDCKNEQ